MTGGDADRAPRLKTRIAELLPPAAWIEERLAQHPFGGEQNYLELARDIRQILDAAEPKRDEAGRELGDALDEVARLEKELAGTREKLAAATRAAGAAAAGSAWREMVPADVRRERLVQQIRDIDTEGGSRP